MWSPFRAARKHGISQLAMENDFLRGRILRIEDEKPSLG